MENKKATPQPSSKLTKVRYGGMPKSHKRTLYLNGSCQNYREVINWVRAMCCIDGGVHAGIQSLNFTNGYPLVQIKVVHLTDDKKKKKVSTKFIISKINLYLIAFNSAAKKHFTAAKGKGKGKAAAAVKINEGMSKHSTEESGNTISEAAAAAAKGKYWFQFANCGYDIDLCATLWWYHGDYGKHSPWEKMERDTMIQSLRKLNADGANKPIQLDDIVFACTTYFIFLSEAARFRPVEFIVCSLLGESWTFVTDESSYPVDMMKVLPLPASSELVEYDHIHSLTKGPVRALFTQNCTSEETKCLRSNYIEKLVRNYSKLSQIWYAYCLRKDTKVLQKESYRQMFSELFVKSGKDLRFTLGVLCRKNPTLETS